MKTVIALALSLAAAGAHSAVIQYSAKADFEQVARTTLVEDFEGFSSPNAIIYSSITRNGITYTPISPSSNLVVTGANAAYHNFGSSLNPFRGTALTVSGDENIMVRLSGLHTALSFDGYLNGLGPGSVSVYRGADIVTTFALPNPAGGAKIFMGLTSDLGFDGFRWSTAGGGSLNTAIDTIALGELLPPNPVPEPGSLPLAAAGLLAVFGGHRRRRAGRGA